MTFRWTTVYPCNNYMLHVYYRYVLFVVKVHDLCRLTSSCCFQLLKAISGVSVWLLSSCLMVNFSIFPDHIWLIQHSLCSTMFLQLRFISSGSTSVIHRVSSYVIFVVSIINSSTSSCSTFSVGGPHMEPVAIMKCVFAPVKLGCQV